MINATELRIGNWVLIRGINERVYNNVFDLDEGARYVNDFNESAIDPIPLTPEILEKAGFEKHIDTGNEFYILGGFGLHKNVSYLHNACDCSVDSLHQLQNLYFALTGDELKIKL